MATLTELKHQLGIADLPLKTELDQQGNKTDCMSYKDDEKKIIVTIDNNLAAELQQYPQVNNLKFEKSHDYKDGGLYTLYKIVKYIPDYCEDYSLAKPKDITERNWFSPKGKINRGQFAIRTLPCIALFAFLVSVLSPYSEIGMGIVLALVYVYFVQQIKRLRDMGLSAWFGISPLIFAFGMGLCPEKSLSLTHPSVILFFTLFGSYTLFLMFCKKIDKEKLKVVFAKIGNNGYVSKKMSNSEIIVASIVVGTIIALILGFVFCNDYVIRTNGIKVYVPRDYDGRLTVISEFNYLLGLGSLIIFGGITYLILKRKNKR